MATCATLITELTDLIDAENYKIIDNMTETKMQYEYVCIKPSVTYDFYFADIKQKFENKINAFINNTAKCSSVLSNIIYTYELTSQNMESVKKVQQLIKSGQITKFSDLKGNTDVSELIFDVIATQILNRKDNKFVLHPRIAESTHSITRLLVDNCYCQIIDMFMLFVSKYQDYFKKKWEGKSKPQIVEILKADYSNFKALLSKINTESVEKYTNSLVNNLAGTLMNIYDFSLHEQVQDVVPDSIGSLKPFFVKKITEYYTNLHPIIWMQIFKKLVDNLFIELPVTPEQILQFVSKTIMLNSGPFILKLLQMIDPLLSQEAKNKYNLNTLKYPLMTPPQVDLVLSKNIRNNDMLKRIVDVSASVGHVCIAYYVNKPSDVFIIKIIKPLSIAQSCWEYSILYNKNADASEQCEQTFIKKMLESNGAEMNVLHELENIRKGHEYYTASYNDVFSQKINVSLTTVQEKQNVMNSRSWMTFAMTLAPGYSVKELLEKKHIHADTKFRAKLHRCLDLLVFKFFINIVQNGFYHGDLHAGNIFFSYEKNQMTLIDFGAVGTIDLYSNTDDTRILLEILIQSIHFNFDGILDRLTEFLNKRCTSTVIDMNSQHYLDFKNLLIKHKFSKFNHYKEEIDKRDSYNKNVFSSERLAQEASSINNHNEPPMEITSIYSYLDYKRSGKEAIVENRDALPDLEERIGASSTISFVGVLTLLFEYYAKHGVNIALKFGEFFELQKAYILLLGVLNKAGYSSFRQNIVMQKAIMNMSNLKKLFKIKTVYHVFKVYRRESSVFNEYIKAGVPQITGPLPEHLDNQVQENQQVQQEQVNRMKMLYQQLSQKLQPSDARQMMRKRLRELSLQPPSPKRTNELVNMDAAVKIQTSIKKQMQRLEAEIRRLEVPVKPIQDNVESERITLPVNLGDSTMSDSIASVKQKAIDTYSELSSAMAPQIIALNDERKVLEKKIGSKLYNMNKSFLESHE